MLNENFYLSSIAHTRLGTCLHRRRALASSRWSAPALLLPAHLILLTVRAARRCACRSCGDRAASAWCHFLALRPNLSTAAAAHGAAAALRSGGCAAQRRLRCTAAAAAAGCGGAATAHSSRGKRGSVRAVVAPRSLHHPPLKGTLIHSVVPGVADGGALQAFSGGAAIPGPRAGDEERVGCGNGGKHWRAVSNRSTSSLGH